MRTTTKRTGKVIRGAAVGLGVLAWFAVSACRLGQKTAPVEDVVQLEYHVIIEGAGACEADGDAAFLDDEKQRPQRYHTVSKGESLYMISKRYYGTGKYWKKIVEFNQDSMGDSQMLCVGQKLRIPYRESVTDEETDSKDDDTE